MPRPQEEALRKLCTHMVDPKPLRPQVPLSFDPRHVALPEENLVRSAGDRHAIFVDRDANERHRPVKPVEPSATPLRIDGHPASFQSARTIGSPPGPEQIYPSTYGNHTRNQARNGLDNDESHHPIRLTRIIQVWIIRPRRGLVRIIRPGRPGWLGWSGVWGHVVAHGPGVRVPVYTDLDISGWGLRGRLSGGDARALRDALAA